MKKGNYRLKNGEKIIEVIQRHVGSPRDPIVQVRRIVNTIQFWKSPKNPTNILDINTLTEVKATSDVKETIVLGGGTRRDALYSRFDEKSLSSRSKAFRNQIAEAFVQDILMQDGMDNIKEINPQDARLTAARSILEDQEHLQNYLSDPEAFLVEMEVATGVILSDEERMQVIQAANNQEAIYSLFDYAELGESAGDGDTYILVGTPTPDGAPTSETMSWLQQNLVEFRSLHGYLPGYGSYVTEAALRQRVILGPDVTEREFDYIENNVYDVHDCRDGQTIGSLALE